MRINDIENFFEKNVTKKTITELSLDNKNNISLLTSQNVSFDFDSLDNPLNEKDKIKSTDTLYFKDGKVIFVEFKRGARIPEQHFRLKAIESILIFYNYIIANNFTENLFLPNDFFQIYFIYNKENISATALPFFSDIKRKLSLQYKHLISEYHIIDKDEFILKFEN